jgi:hypothetical protein
MSYDLALYTRAFLSRALQSGLGDWRNADPIPREAVQALITNAEAAGFLRSGGGSEFTLDTSQHLAQLNVFEGELAFSIPYSDRANASIELCARIAKEVAASHGLAVWDPQEDEGGE